MSEVRIEIPQGLITDTIRAEIVRQIGSSTEMVEAVIKNAMEATTDRYSKETVFQKAVQDMIIKEARGIFEEWLETHRAAIRDAFLKYLNTNKQKRLAEFAEHLAAGIGAYAVNVRIDLRDRED
uniref:Uncharacterized protein n=1 Tax=viral metagenome TaxID=1070528 RepID=A0A6M3LYY9_9ZZZZ